MSTITITLGIDPSTSRASISYDPSKQLKRRDFVVFKARSSSEVFTVTFPEGSPFVSNVSSIRVGGTTLAEQSSPPEEVGWPSQTLYRFVVAPEWSSRETDGVGNSWTAVPETETGDVEVVPDTGGDDTSPPVVVVPFPPPEEVPPSGDGGAEGPRPPPRGGGAHPPKGDHPHKKPKPGGGNRK